MFWKTKAVQAKAGKIAANIRPYIKRGKGGDDSTRIRLSSPLKWLNSPYRPALPRGIRGRPAPLSKKPIGASPSGKAVDFDSTMRRFESSRPSQAVRGPFRRHGLRFIPKT